MVRKEDSTVSFEEVSVRVVAADSDDYTVAVGVRLSGGRAEASELLLEMRHSPLQLLDLASDGSFDIARDNEDHVSAGRFIPGRERLKRGWGGAELSMLFKWTPRRYGHETALASLSPFAAPCLVVPDMLPVATEATRKIGGDPPTQLLRITLSEELPQSLNAGGVAVLGGGEQAGDTLLQTVIFPSNRAAADYDDLVVTSARHPEDRAALERAYEYARSFVEYLHHKLAPALPVRPVICLSDSRSTYPLAGAYCPIGANEVGAERPTFGKPISVTRLLTQSWIDGGVRLWGENAPSLRLAIGGALGLHWLRESGHATYLKESIKTWQHAIANAQTHGRHEMGDVVRALEVAIFHGFEKPAVIAALAKFVHQNWRRHVHQGVLIALLRSFGVFVPHVYE